MQTNDILDNIIEFLFSISLGDISKFTFVSLSFLYIFFAIALWRQVDLMSSVVEAGDTTILKIISIVHLVGAMVVFILTFILL